MRLVRSRVMLPVVGMRLVTWLCPAGDKVKSHRTVAKELHREVAVVYRLPDWARPKHNRARWNMWNITIHLRNKNLRGTESDNVTTADIRDNAVIESLSPSLLVRLLPVQ